MINSTDEGNIVTYPLISIIVPVYNVDQYIIRCLKSITDQTHKNFEALLIDDGSTDGCGKICDEYERIDKRFKVIHQKNQGVSVARNVGLEHAKGEYIAFVDPDDFIAPNLLERTLDKLIETNADMVVFNALLYGKSHKKMVGWNIERDTYTTDEIKRILLVDNSYIWRKIYKSNVWNNIRFPVGLTYEDTYININILKRVDSITLLKDTLYFYETKQHNSITQIQSINNRYNAMISLIHTLSIAQNLKELKREEKLLYYYTIVSWCQWAFLGVTQEHYDVYTAIQERKKFDPSYAEEKLERTDILFEFYIAKVLSACEKLKLYKDNGIDYQYIQDDMIRHMFRAKCLYKSLQYKSPRIEYLFTSLGNLLVKKFTLTSKQKMLLFLAQKAPKIIIQSEGKKLLKKNI